jgi:hypothetical protein
MFTKWFQRKQGQAKRQRDFERASLDIFNALKEARWLLDNWLEIPTVCSVCGHQQCRNARKLMQETKEIQAKLDERIMKWFHTAYPSDMVCRMWCKMP